MTIKEFKLNSNLTIKEANLLVSFVIKKPLEFILTSSDFKLSSYQNKKLRRLCERRLNGEPMAYLLGEQEFYGLKFKVNHNVLIPRPETELLIESAKLKIESDTTEKVIIDVGTGSGCIAITLAKTLNVASLKSQIIAIDISSEAIKIAKQNAKSNGTDKLITFKQGDLLSPLSTSDLSTFDLIVCANLPYLTPTQVENSPTIQHEPKLALISGSDGLFHYRELFRQANNLQAQKITLLCEIDETQGRAMTALIEKELPLAQFEIKKDLGGYDRLAIITLSKTPTVLNE